MLRASSGQLYTLWLALDGERDESLLISLSDKARYIAHTNSLKRTLQVKS